MRDIRVYKNSLRAKFKAQRAEMPQNIRTAADRKVAARVRSLMSYRNCDLILCYVSTPIEVDTRELITRAVADGKRVAVPRCVPNTRRMEFYAVNSLDELSPGTFGVDEPQPNEERLITDFSGSMCIVPGLCFDKRGYRLGYGKGYYDRFLSKYTGSVVGICYSDCIVNSLITGRFDRSADLVVTERGVISPVKTKGTFRKKGKSYGGKQ